MAGGLGAKFFLTPLPSETELLRIFQDHKADLDALRQLVTAHCVAFSATFQGSRDKAAGPEANARFDRLRRTIGRNAKIYCDRTRQGETVIRIVMGVRGWSAAGSEKTTGFVAQSGHADDSGAVLVEHLEPVGARPPGEYRRHLQGDWYLFYQYFD